MSDRRVRASRGALAIVVTVLLTAAPAAADVREGPAGSGDEGAGVQVEVLVTPLASAHPSAHPTAHPTVSSPPVRGAARVEVRTAHPVVGGPLHVHGTGFAHGRSARVHLYSTPVLLGTVQVRADGTFDLVTTVPTTTVPGTHHVRVVPVDGGTPVDSAAFRIDAALPGRLPVTGASAGLAVSVAAFLVLAGGAVLVSRGRGPLAPRRRAAPRPRPQG